LDERALGLFNLLIGYLLVCRVGTFSIRNNRHVAIAGIGALLTALMLAQVFARVYAGR
jgi:hypothetical protein